MAQQREQGQPPFETHATAEGVFTDAEMDRLIAEHAPLLEEGKLGAGATAAQVRRSRTPSTAWHR